MAGQADTTAAAAQSKAKNMGTTAMAFAETNVRSAFDLACNLVSAKDLQEVLAVQSDYAKAQVTTIEAQAKELVSLLQAEFRNETRSATPEMRTDGSPRRTESRLPSSRMASGSNRGRRVDQAAFQASARTMAELKGVEIARRDLADSGGTYGGDELRRFLGLDSEDEVRRLIESRSILAIRDARNEDRFPVIQFLPEGSIVDGLGSVMEALPTRNPWAVLNFMIRPNSRLGNLRPIDLLKAGHLAPVLEAARSTGLQGA